MYIREKYKSPHLRLKYLVINITAWEERTTGVGELGEDAAGAPHVDAGGVELGPEQNVRWAVPECDHLHQGALHIIVTTKYTIMSYLGTVTSDWDPEGPSQTKVCEFQLPILVDQKILWFEIPAEEYLSFVWRRVNNENFLSCTCAERCEYGSN